VRGRIGPIVPGCNYTHDTLTATPGQRLGRHS
jgi:hypothetical protein